MKTVFDVLNDKIVSHRRDISEALCSGVAKDYSEYRDLCGLIRGLEIAQREVNDLAQNFMEEDND